MNEKKKVQVTFQLNVEVLELVDTYASKLGLSRALMLRNLIHSGLSDANAMNATGVLDIVGLIRHARKNEGIKTVKVAI